MESARVSVHTVPLLPSLRFVVKHWGLWAVTFTVAFLLEPTRPRLHIPGSGLLIKYYILAYKCIMQERDDMHIHFRWLDT